MKVKLRHQGAAVVETTALLTGYCPTCDGWDRDGWGVMEELVQELPPECVLGMRDDMRCGYCGDCLFVTVLWAQPPAAKKLEAGLPCPGRQGKL